MPRGGKRNGAGRPAGVPNGKSGKTSVTASRLFPALEIEQATPLDVMVKLMKFRLEQGDLDGAAEIAKDAAPYFHSRKAAVAVSGGLDVGVIHDDDWYSNAAQYHAANGEGASAADPPASGQDEGGRVRPALGQDHARANGHG